MDQRTGRCGTCAFWERVFGKTAKGTCLMRREPQSDCPQWASLAVLKDGGPLQSLWRTVAGRPLR